MNFKTFLLLALFFPLLNACEAKTTAKSVDYRKPIYYVDKATFAKGRPCVEVLFKCLPESLDKGWQSEKQNIDNAIDFFELTPAVNARYKKVVKDWNRKYDKNPMSPYVISDKDKAFFDEVELKNYLKDREESLEKEFPGFWRDVPKPVRYRWIRRAISKAKKYGYEGEMTDSTAIIELCARIGLDFDLNPKWKAITRFISHPDRGHHSYAGSAVDYIDFTIFEKNMDRTGSYKLTSWSLQKALRYLPYPERKVPSLK